MRRLALGLAVALALASGAGGAEDAAEAARAAAARLDRAAEQLEAAQSARDRVRALTATVRAFEDGLEAMREGLRRAAIRETQLARSLAARDAEVAGLLGALLTVEAAPPPVLMMHPGGVLGAARAGIMLSEVSPALHARAASLRRDLEEVRVLRRLQETARDTLETGLAGVQQARAELSQAIADRSDLPRRFVADPVRTAILISGAETLEGFASGLSEIAEGGEIPPVEAELSAEKGDLPLPVQGVILRRAGEADAAGVVREGLVVATRPRALVTAPAAATIRYRGPLLDLGNVTILEPKPGVLIVLSGMAHLFGDTGQVIPAGTPVGLMGGADPEAGAILTSGGDGSGAGRPESLYIEVREDNSPVDPLTWFRTDEDE